MTGACPAALGGTKVLDASSAVAGQFCARMLADYGAAVTLVEPPCGVETRRMGPYGPDGSLLFFHLNHGKALATLDRQTAPGRDEFVELAATADVVVTDDAALAQIVQGAHPACIVSLLTPFGPDGPLAHWQGGEMVFQALSGMMHSNGEYGRPPLYGVGHRASCSAGLVAYIGILAALLARRQHGGGQTVRTDIAETAASMCFPYVMQYLYNGTVRTRNDQKQPVCPVECRDGWICMWIYPHLFARACTVLGVPELIGDPRFSATPARQENWSEFVAIMANRLAGRGSEELVAMLQDNGIIAAKAYRPTELVGSEHLRERGYWETIRTPHGERLVLGPQFRFSATPRRLQELWHPALATEGSA